MDKEKAKKDSGKLERSDDRPLGSVSRWIQRTREGDDDEDLKKLMERYQTRFEATARRYLGSNNMCLETSEDIVISAFYDFWQIRKRYDGIKRREDFSAFMRRIVQNNCHDARKKATAKKRGSGKIVSETDLFNVQDGSNFRLQDIESESHNDQVLVDVIDEFDSVVNSLGKKMPDLVRMIWLSLDGFSNARIAKKLGVSERTIKRRWDELNRQLNSPGQGSNVRKPK